MANRYWVGGTGTWSTSTTPWRATSGGVGAVSAPTSADDVFFDSGSGSGTITLTGTLNCRSLNITAVNAFTFTSTGTMTIQSTVLVPSNITWSGTGIITHTGTGLTRDITWSPATGAPPLTFSGSTATYNLLASITTRLVTSTIIHTAGTMNLNGFNITCGIWSGSGSTTRAINFSTGYIFLVNSSAGSTVVSIGDATNFTATGDGGFSFAASATRTYSVGTTTLGSTLLTSPPNLFITSGASIITIGGTSVQGYFRNADFSGYTGALATTSLFIYGNLTLGTTNPTSLTLTFRGNLSNTSFNPNGRTAGVASVTFTMISNTFSLTGALICSTMTFTTGIIDFQSNTVTCSSTITWSSSSVTLVNIGTLQCTTFTQQIGFGNLFDFTAGTIICTTAYTITNGDFNLNGGTLTTARVNLNSASTFNLYSDLTLSNTTTSQFNWNAATNVLNLNGYVLTCAIFFYTYSVTLTGTLNFGGGYIVLNNTTAASTALSMININNFITDQTGYFVIAPTSTKILNYGSGTGATTTNTLDIYINGGGSTITLTSNSYFRTIDFTGSTSIVQVSSSTGIRFNNMILGSGTYTGIAALPQAGGGYLTSNGKTLAAFTMATADMVNYFYLNDALTVNGAFTMNSGYIDVQFVTISTNQTNTSSFTGYAYAATQAGGYIAQLGTVVGSASISTNMTVGGTNCYYLFDSGTLTFGTVTQSTSTSTFIFAGGVLNCGNFTHSGGLLNLNDYSLSCIPVSLNTLGIFNSSGTVTRSIYTGDNAYSVIYVRSIAMNDVTNFSWVNGQVGNFQCDGGGNGSMVFGTTGGTIANAPNLLYTVAVVNSQSISGYWNILNFNDIGAVSSSGTLTSCRYLTLPSSGTLTGLNVTIGIGQSGYISAPAGSPRLGNVILDTGVANNAGLFGEFKCTNLTLTSGVLESVEPYSYGADSIDVLTLFTWATTNFAINQGIGVSPAITTLDAAFTNVTWGPSWPTYFRTTGTITVNANATIDTGGDNGWVTCTTLTQSGVGSVVKFGSYNSGAWTCTVQYTMNAGSMYLNTGYLGDPIALITPVWTSSAASGVARNIYFQGYAISMIYSTLAISVNWANVNGVVLDQIGQIYGDTVSSRSSTYAWGTSSNNGIANTLNLYINSGTSIPTFTSGGYWNIIDLSQLTLSSNTQNGTRTINIANSLYLPPIASTTGGQFGLWTIVFQGPGLGVDGHLNCSDRPAATVALGILAAVTFNHAGTVYIDTELSTGIRTSGTTGTITHNSGTVYQQGVTIYSNLFTSNSGSTRYWDPGGGAIYLDYGTAGLILNMANASGYTWVNSGGFYTALTVAKTFTCGTTGGSASFAPSVYITAQSSAAAGPVLPTFTSGGWFGVIDLQYTAGTIAATSLNLGGFYMGTGDYTNVTLSMYQSGSLSVTSGTKAIASLTLAGSTTTTDFYGYLSSVGDLVITGGCILNLNGYAMAANTIAMTSGQINVGGGSLIGGASIAQIGGTVSLGGGSMSVTTYTLTTGNITLGSGTLSIQDFSAASAGTSRSITGPGTINCAGNWSVTNGANFTKGADYSIKMLNTGTKTFAGGGGSYGTLIQSGYQGYGTLTITGSNTFADIQQDFTNFPAPSQADFTSVGWTVWTVPTGVFSITAVAIGAGGGTQYGSSLQSGSSGGGGGGLSYGNNMTVFPGQLIGVYVGNGGAGRLATPAPQPPLGIAGEASYVGFTSASPWISGGGGGGGINSSTTSNPGGTGGASGGSLRTGGGAGGAGGAINVDGAPGGGGGGAGGYSGAGGAGGTVTVTSGATGGAGSGGGGGAGGSGSSNLIGGAAGGGVNILGEGTSGIAGPIQTAVQLQGGYAGSGGGDGSGTTTDGSGYGGGYGGGGGGGPDDGTLGTNLNGGAPNGAQGAVRIVWPGSREYPSGLVTDYSTLATQYAIFGFGNRTFGGSTSITNLVSNIGVVSNDVTGVGSGKQYLAAATYGYDKAIFGYGYISNYSNSNQLVSNTGVVAAVNGTASPARLGLAAAGYGTNKAIFGYGDAGSVSAVTNLVSNTGIVAAESASVGFARSLLAAAGYGIDKAIFGYGQSGFSQYSMTNLVSNTGVVSTDTTGVGTARVGLAAAGYGTDKAIFGYGRISGPTIYYSMTNLVSNTGVVATDTTGVGTARESLASAGYGTDKAIFGYGINAGGQTAITNLVSNTGVVSNDTAGVGSDRYGLAAAGYGT
jgi:hypothetical protein